jgi:hypothetical protein
MEPANVAEPPVTRAPSLATLQARWPLVLDRYQGPLLAKMLLSQVIPTALEGEVVTLEGPLDQLDLQRLDSQYRSSIEGLLQQELALPLRVRFRGREGAPEVSPEDDAVSIADYAAALFGGQIVPAGEAD